MNEIIADLLAGTPLPEMARKHGRDFMKHYPEYVEAAIEVCKQQGREVPEHLKARLAIIRREYEEIMETPELIEHLRIMGKHDDRDPNYYLLAADRLEELQEDVDGWIAGFDMLNNRENRRRYLDYWREKNGFDSLWYPDGDEVYADFFAMKALADELAETNERLRKVGEWKWNPNGMDWGLGAWECSECRCKNDNLPMDETIKPLQWAGTKYCPECGVKMNHGR